MCVSYEVHFQTQARSQANLKGKPVFWVAAHHCGPDGGFHAYLNRQVLLA